mmetsp:Transcript_10466/g.18379  ORF Transcript_10466/g.18379 Transcript_10466/m.18379 type:complete len:250 (+) Transcript_10466:551-1300(+)
MTGCVQTPPLVIRRYNEHSHIMLMSKTNVIQIAFCAPIPISTCSVCTHEVIMQVEIVKCITFNRSLNHMRRGMRRETNPTNFPLCPQLAQGIDQISLLAVMKQPVIMVVRVETVNAKQINVVQPQPFDLPKYLRFVVGFACARRYAPFSLDDEILSLAHALIKKRLERHPNLHLGTAVTLGGFDVVHAAVESVLDDFDEIILTFLFDLFRSSDGSASAVPGLLESHASQRNDGHLEFRSPIANGRDLDG